MSQHIIEYDCECEPCAGTGLYVGCAEHSGAAVVCSSCKGKGKVHVKFWYKDFEGLKHRKGIKRVFRQNPGIGVGENEERGLKLEDFGGMPYEDWRAGKRFPKGSEMRKFTCPAWWYQGENYDLKPQWKECICCGGFSECSSFKDKEKCWKRFDKKNPSKKP